MRLFIACNLSQEVLQQIFLWEREVDRRINQSLFWIPLKNLHLTLIFLGHLTEKDYHRIDDIFLNYQGPKKELNLKIEKIDYGPPGTTRMIWLYIEKNRNLEEIKEYFESEIEKRKINFLKEKRQFLPHINLIRLKNIRNSPPIKSELNFYFQVSEISLFQSFLKKEGAEYKKLRSIYLNNY